MQELLKALVTLADVLCFQTVVECDHGLNPICLQMSDKTALPAHLSLSTQASMCDTGDWKGKEEDIAGVNNKALTLTWSQLITAGGSTCKSTMASTTLSPVGSCMIAVDRR